MASLIVFKFESADGADKALNVLKELQKQQLVQVSDAATVSWPAGAKKPKTRQANNLVAVGALDGAFWGMLFGLIFIVPFFGLAIGAAMGALAGKFADYGIDDNFIKDTRDKITEGTSALFVMAQSTAPDRVAEAFQALPKYEILSTNLSAEQEAKLRETFELPGEAESENKAEAKPESEAAA